MMLPRITAEARVVADPTMRFGPSGAAVTNIRLVASKRKKTDSGEWVDDKVCWFNAVCFKQMAEHVAETVQKGDIVVVSGLLETQEYEKNDGTKGTSVNVIVDDIGASMRWTAYQKAEGGNQSPRPAARQQSAPADDPWGGSPEEKPPFSGGF